mmetsp:Transcript_12082/g.18082  ORF Transcript_12082/g.18082 Transcript_12082/m.18082 type:complete len:899 (+) Transcript_12082:1095-3791(+)
MGDSDRLYVEFMQRIINQNRIHSAQTTSYYKIAQQQRVVELEHLSNYMRRQQQQIDENLRKLENECNQKWASLKQSLSIQFNSFQKLHKCLSNTALFDLPSTSRQQFFETLFSFFSTKSLELNSVDSSELELNVQLLQSIIEILSKFGAMNEVERFNDLRQHCIKISERLNNVISTASQLQQHPDRMTTNELRKACMELRTIMDDKILHRLSLGDSNIRNMFTTATDLMVSFDRRILASETPSTKAVSQTFTSPTPTTSNTPTVTPTPKGEEILSNSTDPCAVAAKRRVQWLQGLQSQSESYLLPQDLREQQLTVLQALQLPVLSSPSGLDNFISLSESLLQRAAELGPVPFLAAVLPLFNVEGDLLGLLTLAERSTKESDLLLLAAAASGFTNSGSSSSKQQASLLLRAALDVRSSLNAPDMTHLSMVMEKDSRRDVSGQVRLAALFAAVVARSASTTNGPFSTQEGWTWIVAACSQLYQQLQRQPKNAGSHSQVVKLAAQSIRQFLRLAGHSLLLRYQNQMIALLKELVKVLQPAGVQSIEECRLLLAAVEEAIRNGIIAERVHLMQPPHVDEAMRATRTVEQLSAEVAQLESDRNGPFMLQIRALKIDRMRAIFNKLGATIESQRAAVRALLELLMVVTQQQQQQQVQESMPLLRYTLFKIASTVLADCQEESFFATDETHPTKLARVMSGLCTALDAGASRDLLLTTLRAHFMLACPLLVPRGSPAGLTGEALLKDMAFRQKRIRDTEGNITLVWEERTAWLQRMTKVVCVFAVSILQPEQMPFSLQDGWTWCARMLNLCARYCQSTPPSSPPFYMATALEVFLRVVSGHLLRAFGRPFLSMLRCLLTQVVPHFAVDMPNKDILQEFLQRFTASEGRDFMSIFQNSVTPSPNRL